MRGQILLVQTQDGNPTHGLPPGSRRGFAVRTEIGRPMESTQHFGAVGYGLECGLDPSVRRAFVPVRLHPAVGRHGLTGTDRKCQAAMRTVEVRS